MASPECPYETLAQMRDMRCFIAKKIDLPKPTATLPVARVVRR
jgi:hypothetical protein